MSAQNRVLIRELFAAASAGDLDGVAEFYADDFVDHAVGGARDGTDKAATLRTFQSLLSAFPDTEHSIEDIVAEGDRVVVRLFASGTHSGVFRGIAPTGRRVEMRSTAIYRVCDGRLAERWCDSVLSVSEALAAAEAPPRG